MKVQAKVMRVNDEGMKAGCVRVVDIKQVGKQDW